MKKSPSKASAKGSAAAAAAVAPTSFHLTFSPPTDGLQHLESLIYAHPTDLTSLAILPGDTVVLLSTASHTPTPLYCGRAWPLRKCPQGALRLTCISTLLEGISPGCTLEDAALGVTLHKVGAASPGEIPPLPVAQHVRIIRRVGEAVGAPSMATLQRGMLGVALPACGLEILLPNTTTTSEPSSGTTDSATTPSLPPFLIKVSPQPHQGSTPPCMVVTGDTVFTEGAPSRRPPTAAVTTTTTPHISQQQHMGGKANTPPPPLGGLDTQFNALLTMARNALDRISSSSSSLHSQGALLSGPPGTGKTHLVRCVCSALGVVPVVVTGGEIMSDVVGEAEGRLREAWERARRSGGVLFLDEVDTLCPSRDLSGVGEVEARLVAQLTGLMDGSGGGGGGGGVGGVFVIGATNRPGVLDPSLRRPGRFDVEMTVGVPTASAREDILWACLQRYGPSCVVTREEAGRVSQGKMHGFVGADIAGACREASWVSIRRTLHHSSGGGGVEMDLSARFQSSLTLGDAASTTSSTSTPPPPLASLQPSPPITSSVTLTLEDLVAGIARVQPSALREVAVEVAQTPWSAIAGQEEVKARLREANEWPIKYAHLFTALGISPPRGILLYGPPGCSKTMMARALATSGAMNFISIKGPELLSKYVGDSEKAVARVFSLARGAAPCLLFFDEFDSLGVRRDGGGGEDGGGGSGVGVRVVAQLLQEMDGLRGGGGNGNGNGNGNGGRVLLVAATNRPDLLDPALLRPGRMDQLLYVGLPDAPARAAIALSHFTGLARNGACVTVTPEEVAGVTEGMSGAEVTGVLRDAGSRALQEAMEVGEEGATTTTSSTAATAAPAPPTLARSHVESAAAAVPRQITPAMLQFYSDWAGRSK